MTYTRPDLEAAKAELQKLTADLRAAKDYDAAREAFLAQDKLERRIDTQGTLCSIRHSIDTRDEFYDAEQTFWNSAAPELQEYVQQWTEALLESPFRKEFAGGVRRDHLHERGDRAQELLARDHPGDAEGKRPCAGI